jgi:hypothetical protein
MMIMPNKNNVRIARTESMPTIGAILISVTGKIFEN